MSDAEKPSKGEVLRELVHVLYQKYVEPYSWAELLIGVVPMIPMICLMVFLARYKANLEETFRQEKLAEQEAAKKK